MLHVGNAIVKRGDLNITCQFKLKYDAEGNPRKSDTVTLTD
jgi:hypothetical protein